MNERRKSARGVEKRGQITEAIAAYSEAHGYAPTVRELAGAVGLRSTNTVWSHLLYLRQLGRVTWQEGAGRTLRLI